MVEPISIALLSGAAGLGMALGRLSRKKDDTDDSLPPAFNFGLERDPIEPVSMQFFAVEDVVNPSEIIEMALSGTQVFVSIKKLLKKTDKLYRFVHTLKQAIETRELEMHQIAKDLLLVTNADQPIQVKTLKRMAETDMDDKLLHKSVVGY